MLVTGYKKFIEISLSNFYQYTNFEALINDFNTKVVGHKYLLEEKVESINLSVFNHWLSVGPVDLWKAGDSYDSDLIRNKIKSRPK